MCVSSAVCSVRVIGESDIMQEFLSESDEVEKIKINMSFCPFPACDSLRCVCLSGCLCCDLEL